MKLMVDPFGFTALVERSLARSSVSSGRGSSESGVRYDVSWDSARVERGW